MSVTTSNSKQPKNQHIPKRRFGKSGSVSIVGLGCSSFSTFFWTAEDFEEASSNTSSSSSSSSSWTPDSLDRSHPRVQEWIETIRYAICEAGITLLDTAPWYGHGTSEVVVGWGLADLLGAAQPSSSSKTTACTVQRSDLMINTKVGRYEADPVRQFDFSYQTTVDSVQRSLQRLHCDYIDVLQLHDLEFSPSLEILLKECIPAMMECRKRGWCKSLGMTGYPLSVQHQILQASMQEFEENVWDQALTYGHFNLHDTSLMDSPISSSSSSSYFSYCKSHSMECLAAAPLSMGLLTHAEPPDWHPAGAKLKEACRRAAQICASSNNDKGSDDTKADDHVDLAQLALLFALSEPRIPSTILGMKDVAQVQVVQTIANRFDSIDAATIMSLTQQEILDQVLPIPEKNVLEKLRDQESGPFAEVWKTGEYQWDGVLDAWKFWEQVESVQAEKWQVR